MPMGMPFGGDEGIYKGPPSMAPNVAAPTPGPFAAQPTPMPPAGPAPSAGGPFGMPAPQQPGPRPEAVQDRMKFLIPALVAAFGPRIGPQGTAALLTGLMHGRDQKLAMNEHAEATQRRRALEAAEFRKNAVDEMLASDTPEELQAKFTALQGMAEFHGVDLHSALAQAAGVVAPRHQEVVSAKAKASAAAVVKRNDELAKGKAWSAPDPKTGNNMPDAWWRQQAGEGGTLDDGSTLRPEAPKPEQFTLGEGQQRVDANGNVIASGPAKAAPPQDGFTMSPGQVRYGPDGKAIARAPAKADGGLPTGAGGGPTGDAYLQTLSPQERQLVKQIADYKMDISKVTSLRGDQRTRVAQMVAQYDPTFDMSQYSSRTKMRGDFNTGKASQNIRSLNTAVGHLATLQEKADGLKNSSIPLWNAVANRFESASGDPRIVEFNTAANAVEGELASLFKGTGATDSEIKAWRDQLHSSQSPAQLTGAIQTAVELMHSRLQALDDQWKQGMGKPRDFQILSNKSRETLKGLGIDVSGWDGGTEGDTGNDGKPTEGETRPIAEPGYPPGAEQTYRGGQWIRTK